MVFCAGTAAVSCAPSFTEDNGTLEVENTYSFSGSASTYLG